MTRHMRVGLRLKVDKAPRVWEQIQLASGARRWARRPGLEGLPDKASESAVTLVRVLNGMVEMGEQGARARVVVEVLCIAVCWLAWAAEATFRCGVLAAHCSDQRRSAMRALTRQWARRTEGVSTAARRAAARTGRHV